MTAFPVNIRLGRGADRLIAASSKTPALFLDRDGVLIEDRDFVRTRDETILIPGAAATVAEVNRAGVPVVVVSNQSGVGRGYFGWGTVAEVDEHLALLLAAEGAELDLVLSAGAAPGAVEGASFRKPGPSMIVLAARLASIDLGRSWIVGDKASDLEAGAAAGLAGGTLIPGKAGERAPGMMAGGAFECRTAADLAEAVASILPRLLQLRVKTAPARGRSL